MTAMAYDEDVNAVLENIVKARKDIKYLFICTKNTIVKIKDQLNFPTSDTGAGDGVFLESINTLLLSKEVENRIDEATWEPAIVLFSRKKSQLVPFIFGLELLPKDWTDHACATVYEKNSFNCDNDHVSIYYCGDDEIIEESEQINMDETGCKPERDWPERAANADPRSTVLFVRTSLIELLNRGLKVVEVYGSEDDLVTVIANIEKHDIRPNVIVYVMDVLEEQMSLFQKLESLKLSCVLYPMYETDVDVVTSRLSELHLNHKVYADVQERPHLLSYLTRCVETNVNELTKAACENLVEVNKKLINQFEDQLQKMFKPCPRNESDPNSIDPIEEYFDEIKNSERKYEERFKKEIINLRDGLKNSNNKTWDAAWELTTDKESDVTSFPRMMEFFWTDSFFCYYRKNCFAQIDKIIKECVRQTLFENLVTSKVKFRQLGDKAVQELSKWVCDKLEQKLITFHDDFMQQIKHDFDASNLFQDIAYKKRRELRFLMEEVAVNELKAQCWLDRPRFIDIQEQEKIGEGTGGYVIKVGRNAELLAMKVLSFHDESGNVETDIELMAIEVHYLRLFEHKNIVQILGSQIRDDGVRILMPLLQDAKNYFKSRRTFDRKLELAMDVAHALQYLHERNVFHRDVKWQNVLIDGDGVGKLCDFGLTIMECSSQKSNCGTDPYRAPEIGNGPYDKSVDIYAFGTLLWTFVMESEPRYRRTSGGGSYELTKTQCTQWDCNRCWPHLIYKCHCIPKQRPTIEEVICMLKEMMHLKHW